MRMLVLMLLGMRIQACPEGSYRDPSSGLEDCLPCDVCDEGSSYLRPCGPEANAVCKCPPGRECGGNTCVRCHCPEGQEPTKDGGCQRCPEGEFSDGTSGPCRPWSRCPPGHRIQTPGMEESDVVCQPEPEGPTVPNSGIPTTKKMEPSTRLLPIALLAAALLSCHLVLLFFCRLWVQGKPQEGPCRQPAQEVDDCSYCFPEEEEGDGGGEGFLTKGELLLLEKVP
ncbi:tumor necrosis factor receptor superfamily member 9 [Anolis carolinensis]|uniref:tumor necrosis factor receptor superfamily member 9 n=1 Tax=Anolis carolinensis TaxID=28377 RepID=UPI002F2B83FC